MTTYDLSPSKKNWIQILDETLFGQNFIIEYSKEDGVYRVSLFDDIGHWQSECVFYEYGHENK